MRAELKGPTTELRPPAVPSRYESARVVGGGELGLTTHHTPSGSGCGCRCGVEVGGGCVCEDETEPSQGVTHRHAQMEVLNGTDRADTDTIYKRH